MKERLEVFLQNQGLKPGKFAQIMGVQPSNITHIISGRSKPGFDFISNMLTNFPEINPDWLILGTGDMYRKAQTQTSPTIDNSQQTSLFEEEPVSEEQTADVNRDDAETIIVFHKDGTFSKYTQR